MTDRINRAIARFEEAVRADAWKGSQHPEDIPRIERELIRTKRSLHLAIAGLLGEDQLDRET